MNQLYPESESDSDEDRVHEELMNELHVLRRRRAQDQRRPQDQNSAENSQPCLKENILQFMQDTEARDVVIEESPTLQLVKALHEQKLEHVMFATTCYNAVTTFAVCLIFIVYCYSPLL